MAPPQPKTREERRAGADKASKEKARIAARNPRVEPPPADVIVPLPNTSQYLEGHLRWAERDAAAAEHARKQNALMNKEVRGLPALEHCARVRVAQRSRRTWACAVACA